MHWYYLLENPFFWIETIVNAPSATERVISATAVGRSAGVASALLTTTSKHCILEVSTKSRTNGRGGAVDL